MLCDHSLVLKYLLSRKLRDVEPGGGNSGCEDENQQSKYGSNIAEVT